MRRPGPVVVFSLACAAVVVVLHGGGLLGNEQYPSVHGRQIVLPEGGAVTSVEAMNRAEQERVVGWPRTSVWGMAQWKAHHLAPDQLVRLDDPDHVALVSFGPSPPRSSKLTLRWSGSGLLWFKDGSKLEMPLDFRDDAVWLSRVAASAPDLVWMVGLDASAQATLCWLAPVTP